MPSLPLSLICCLLYSPSRRSVPIHRGTLTEYLCLYHLRAKDKAVAGEGTCPRTTIQSLSFPSRKKERTIGSRKDERQLTVEKEESVEIHASWYIGLAGVDFPRESATRTRCNCTTAIPTAGQEHKQITPLHSLFSFPFSPFFLIHTDLTDLANFTEHTRPPCLVCPDQFCPWFDCLTLTNRDHSSLPPRYTWTTQP